MRTIWFSCSAACFGALLLGVAFIGPVAAQTVFKCSVNGKTTYQSTPCDTERPGKPMDLVPGPSAEEAQQARARAEADKARVAAAAADRPSAASAPSAPREPGSASSPEALAECARLSEQRGAAFGRRNGALRASKRDDTDRSPKVDLENDDIQRIESRMRDMGCRPS